MFAAAEQLYLQYRHAKRRWRKLTEEVEEASHAENASSFASMLLRSSGTSVITGITIHFS